MLMKILSALLCSLLLFVSTAFAASDTDRWLLVGNDSPNKNEWFIDSKTLKINDNKSVSFWAKVVLHNPKYDIKEIKLKYLLSADQIQLTKLQEIGYSNKEEILWNTNVTKTISVIPGSGNEKLINFIDKLIQEQKEQDKQEEKEQARKKEQDKDREQDKKQNKEQKKPEALQDSEEKENNAPGGQKPDINVQSENHKESTTTEKQSEQ